MRDAMSGLPTSERVETLVLGGGQAGVSVGYHLAQRGLPFLILDANERIGDAWRRRWDSLRLFTPARYNALPGMPFPGPAHSFSTKNEVADYLEAYAAKFELPVRTGVRVERLSRNGSRLVVEAGERRFEAENVVVAMGSDQVPRMPPFAHELHARIVQLHSAEYRNHSQLRAGPVLVVGVGNSGAEIAVEVAKEHPTWLAGEEAGHVPFRIEGTPARFVFLPLLFRLVGHRVLTVRTPIGRRMRPKLLSHGAPLVRVKPKDLAAAGIERVPRVVGARRRTAVAGGRPCPRSGERHLVHRIPARLLVGRPARLRGGEGAEGADSPPRGRRRRAGALFRRALLPLCDVVRIPSRCRKRRRTRRQGDRIAQQVNQADAVVAEESVGGYSE